MGSGYRKAFNNHRHSLRPLSARLTERVVAVAEGAQRQPLHPQELPGTLPSQERGVEPQDDADDAKLYETQKNEPGG